MALIGTHISVAGGLDKAFPRADALGCESMQIFTRSQRQWAAKPVTLSEAEDFFRAWQKSSVKAVVSHASYLINIASPDDEMREKSYTALKAEAERCHQLGIDDIVLHPGFGLGLTEEEAIKNIAGSLLRLFEETPEYTCRILLETMAGQGSVIGANLEHFTKIQELLNYNERAAFCVDTCHVFAAGYDLRTEDAYERFISLIEKHIGADNVLCWHLNDSKAEKGSNLDRHTHLGDGQIGVQPFALLMNDERFADIPTILETPKEGVGDEGNLSFLRKVRGK